MKGLKTRYETRNLGDFNMNLPRNLNVDKCHRERAASDSQGKRDDQPILSPRRKPASPLL